MTIRITTNNKPREIIDASQLTAKERSEFDYLDWEALEAGEDSASFIRYKGELYDLGDVPNIGDGPFSQGSPKDFPGWNGIVSDSFFSGIVFRWVDIDDDPMMVVGTYYVED